MIRIGPHVFSGHDAARTMACLPRLWAEMTAGRASSPAVVRLRDDLAGRLAGELGAATPSSLSAVSARAARIEDPALLAAVLADAWQTLQDASDVLRREGRLPVTTAGAVTQLSTSAGGVPKLPVDVVDVDHRGIRGDVQRARLHHGRPWQALCIYADEVIDALRAEGHPISRGAVGENVTTAGIEWADVRPGVRLRIGEVLAFVQSYAEPCKKNARHFLGGDFNRMNIDRGPVSRVYATVLEPGRIVTGDAVVLEPAQ